MQSTSFAFQAYQVLRYGSLLLSAIALAWFETDKETIAQYETLLLIGGSATFFWVGGLLDGFLLLQKKADPLRSDAILVRAGQITSGLAVASAMACIIVGFIFYRHIDGKLLAAFGVYFCMETMSQMLPHIYVAKDKARELLAFGLFSGIGYCLAVGIPTAMSFGLEAIVFALLGLGVFKAVWFVKVCFGGDETASEKKGVGAELWRISGPLVLATLLSQSAVYVDGFLVQSYFPHDFVDFRYGAKEFPLVLLLANSMSVVRAGEIAAGIRKGNVDEAFQDLKAGSNRLIWTMFPISIALLIVSGPLYDFVFVHRFPNAVPVFDLFLLLAIPRLMFPQSVIRGFQKTLVMSFSAGVELVLNVGLSLLLMQFYGIAGIAAGTVIAFFVEKAILLGYAQYKLKIAWHRYASVTFWLGGSLLLLLVWAMKYVILPNL